MEPTYHLPMLVHEKGETEDFEGPLYLILQLLAKNKIEISELNISDILDQYLAWMEEMKALDIEVTGEFVQMASHLLLIKTKMLLSPGPEEVSELEALMQSLDQLRAKDTLERVRQTLPELGALEERGMLCLTKEPEPRKGASEYRYRHEPRELLGAFRDMLVRSSGAEEEEEDLQHLSQRIVPKRILYSVRDKSREIMDLLRDQGTLPLQDLYRAAASRSELVAVFVSVLELCSLGCLGLMRSDGGITLEYRKEADTEELKRLNEEEAES